MTGKKQLSLHKHCRTGRKRLFTSPCEEELWLCCKIETDTHCMAKLRITRPIFTRARNRKWMDGWTDGWTHQWVFTLLTYIWKKMAICRHLMVKMGQRTQPILLIFCKQGSPITKISNPHAPAADKKIASHWWMHITDWLIHIFFSCSIYLASSSGARIYFWSS